MSFSLLRAPLRRAAATGARSIPRAQFRSSYRHYSTPPPEAKSNNNLLIGLGAVAGIGGLSFYYYSSTRDAELKSGLQAAKVKANFVPTKEDYQKVYNKIAELLDEAGEYDDGSYGPLILRLAWHSSGTYDKETKTGGSNYATMRFQPESLHGANNGLNLARDLMEKVKSEFPWISYGDLWTLGGVAAIQEMQGPKVPWRAGRIDGVATDATPDGRLPDATQGADHLRNIFGRMGFNDQEIVALSGAHALGRCHTDRSGFVGPWTFSPTTLTNEYYKLLFNETTDYVLVQDKSFKKYAKAYAQDSELFFRDFASVVSRLFELGVPTQQWVTPEPWIMKSLEEQHEEKK
ncbi:hypothetical protein H0H81_007645 [Sphagnurus paluster]|uniref:Peroxidase n=1 Tax=Sphagnurus paluster TaxID=117069 RepID=A0A9P7FUU4_9AGAR|nr:hypothetical protein H0H81_007645 [Sphagnurus paluster]